MNGSEAGRHGELINQVSQRRIMESVASRLVALETLKTLFILQYKFNKAGED